MKTLMTSALIAGCMLVAGCVSKPSNDATAQAMAASKGELAHAKSERSTMVGSRIPRKTTDHSVKQIGNQDYRDDNQIKSLGNEIARPGQ